MKQSRFENPRGGGKSSEIDGEGSTNWSRRSSQTPRAKHVSVKETPVTFQATFKLSKMTRGVTISYRSTNHDYSPYISLERFGDWSRSLLLTPSISNFCYYRMYMCVYLYSFITHAFTPAVIDHSSSHTEVLVLSPQTF